MQYHKMTVAQLHAEARNREWKVGFKETKDDLVRQLNRDDRLKSDKAEAARLAISTHDNDPDGLNDPESDLDDYD